MKSNQLILVMVLTLLASYPAPVAFAQRGAAIGATKVETIETADLQKMLADQQQAAAQAKEAGTEVPEADFVVVDVRSEAEVDVSIIPGAITKADYEKNSQQYEGRLVIPYCTVGGRSGAYAKQLSSKGVKVKNYQGSILKWVDAGLPLVTLKGEPTNRVHTHSKRNRVPAAYEQVIE